MVVVVVHVHLGPLTAGTTDKPLSKQEMIGVTVALA